MKNVIMSVTIGDKSFSIGHVSKMGNLNELVAAGNLYREELGLEPMLPRDMLRRQAIMEYIYMLENKTIIERDIMSNADNQEVITHILPILKSGVKHVIPKGFSVVKTKKGLNPGTWVHLKVLIRVAIEMNPEFADDVIETFIKGKILEHRDLAGENYKSLAASASIFPNVNYRQLAKALNWNIFNKHVKDIRKTATADQLDALHKLEEQLCFVIDMGYIKSFDQLMNDLRKRYNFKHRRF